MVVKQQSEDRKGPGKYMASKTYLDIFFNEAPPSVVSTTSK